MASLLIAGQQSGKIHSAVYEALQTQRGTKGGPGPSPGAQQHDRTLDQSSSASPYPVGFSVEHPQAAMERKRQPGAPSQPKVESVRRDVAGAPLHQGATLSTPASQQQQQQQVVERTPDPEDEDDLLEAPLESGDEEADQGEPTVATKGRVGASGGGVIDEALEDLFLALVNGQIDEALEAVPDLAFMTVPYLSMPDPLASSLLLKADPMSYPLLPATAKPSLMSGTRNHHGALASFSSSGNVDDDATTDDSEEWSLFDAPPAPASPQKRDAITAGIENLSL
jgi:hypothetical protein